MKTCGATRKGNKPILSKNQSTRDIKINNTADSFAPYLHLPNVPIEEEDIHNLLDTTYHAPVSERLAMVEQINLQANAVLALWQKGKWEPLFETLGKLKIC